MWITRVSVIQVAVGNAAAFSKVGDKDAKRQMRHIHRAFFTDISLIMDWVYTENGLATLDSSLLVRRRISRF